MSTEQLKLVGKKIFLVEDDPGILNLLKTFFLGHGAMVEVERDGKNVVRRVGEIRPDILILDVILPYVDGFTILKNMREQGIKTPTIMLTDKSTVDDKVKGLDFGADDYMTKPFSTKELLARTENLFRRSAVAENNIDGEIIPIGPLQILPESREIRVNDGKILRLTKTEFDLLCFLARKSEKVVSHATLLKEVLGYRGDIETKALVMHIANMRKKFSKIGLTDIKIETVAGVGYKLVAIPKLTGA